MSKKIAAGIVTAYGAAVRGGYPGTYEEFCAALGDLARVLEDFEGFSVSVTTLEPGESATADYSDGVLTLGIPAGETGNGIASAELNQNYTLTLTWTNGESTTVGPIRGATGQTPNLTIGTVETLDPDESATATITGTPEDPVLNLGIPQGESGGGDAGDITFDPEEDYDEGTVGAELSQQKNAIDQKQDAPSSAGTAGQVLGLDSNLDPVWVNQSGGGDVSNCAPIIINTASGDIATFTDGADNRQIRKIVGTIVPQQSGTGDPSPDNVRPISGWTVANIYHSDGNMICAPQGEWYQTFIPAGTPVSASVEKGSQSTIYYYRKDKTYIDYWTVNVNRGNRYGRTFAPQEDVYYVKFDGGTNAVVRKGSALYDYLPYANVLPINWQSEAGTIYGGTVTLNEDGSADVVADKAAYDMGSLPWGTGYNVSLFNTTFTYMPIIASQNFDGWIYCSCFKPMYGTSLGSIGTNIANNQIMGRNTYRELYIKDTRFTSPEDFKAAVTGQTLVVPLENPATYHFDNIGQLYTCFGANNVWIDTGSITECDYPADTKLYIDGLTAPDEDMIANANITSGKYFVVNNQLYLSTAAIAAGASIVPGTNCTATNLAEALNALNT